MHYGPIYMGDLERGEESCLRNCVNAFKEIWFWPEEELRRLVWGDVRFKVLLYLSTMQKVAVKLP